MNCKNHPASEAVYVCRYCGRAICLECTVELNGKNYCKECLAKVVNKGGYQHDEKGGISYIRKKSRLLTFMMALVPGGGHMYLGLINRGLALMGTFFGALFGIMFLSDILGMDWYSGFLIPAICVISIFYSVFDAHFLANELNEGRSVRDLEDSGININGKIMGKVVLTKKNMGYGLLVLGMIGIINTLFKTLRDLLWYYLKVQLPYPPSRFLMPVLMVAAGIYLLRKSKLDTF